MDTTEPKLCTTNGEPVEKVRAEQTNAHQFSTFQEDGSDVLACRICRRTKAEIEHGRVTQCVPPVDRSALCTTNGQSPEEVRQGQTNETGQHAGYIVLCEDERKKGFVRPYRDAYKHVGISQELVNDAGETFQGPRTRGCGSVTTMGRALSETYARDPSFYGATFCCNCNRHLPVAEFVWTADGAQVGS